MPKPTKTTALGAVILLAVLVVTMNTLSGPPAATPRPVVTAATSNPGERPATTATPPFSIDAGMLMAIDSLPTDLMEMIQSSTYSRTEIVEAQSTTKTPLEPMAPWVNEVWCITIYPEATMTLYIQPYVAPKDAIHVQSGDFVPGEKGRGMIDHYLAFKRGEVWELYHPEVYSWNKLGC